MRCSELQSPSRSQSRHCNHMLHSKSAWVRHQQPAPNRHVFISRYVYTDVYTYTHISVRAYAYIHVHIQIHIFTMYVYIYTYIHTLYILALGWSSALLTSCIAEALEKSIKRERWGAGVETQKNIRGEVGGWGRVPFNEPYAPSISTIYDGAQGSLNS